jgi:hypothetical protein
MNVRLGDMLRRVNAESNQHAGVLRAMLRKGDIIAWSHPSLATKKPDLFCLISFVAKNMCNSNKSSHGDLATLKSSRVDGCGRLFAQGDRAHALPVSLLSEGDEACAARVGADLAK